MLSSMTPVCIFQLLQTDSIVYYSSVSAKPVNMMPPSLAYYLNITSKLKKVKIA
jgi:hypothetical protein